MTRLGYRLLQVKECFKYEVAKMHIIKRLQILNILNPQKLETRATLIKLIQVISCHNCLKSRSINQKSKVNWGLIYLRLQEAPPRRTFKSHSSEISQFKNCGQRMK